MQQFHRLHLWRLNFNTFGLVYYYVFSYGKFLPPLRPPRVRKWDFVKRFYCQYMLFFHCFIGFVDLGGIFDFLDFQKIPFSNQKLTCGGTVSRGERPCRDPAFNEAKVITVPLGPTVY